MVSCFEVKPRLTRRERQLRQAMESSDDGSPPKDDHKTFRLCIVREDRQQLLIADNWPADAVVSDWAFKPKDQHTIPNYGHIASVDVHQSSSPSQIMSTLSGDEVNRVQATMTESNDSSENMSLLDQTMDQTIITVDLDSTLAADGSTHEQSIGSQSTSQLSSTPQ